MSDQSTPNTNEAARVLSFGEKAVGITFNPGNNSKVESIKRKYADIIDELNDLRSLNPDNKEIGRMCSVAITEAQTSQMWAVKAATWSY